MYRAEKKDCFLSFADASFEVLCRLVQSAAQFIDADCEIFHLSFDPGQQIDGNDHWKSDVRYGFNQ